MDSPRQGVNGTKVSEHGGESKRPLKYYITIDRPFAALGPTSFCYPRAQQDKVRASQPHKINARQKRTTGIGSPQKNRSTVGHQNQVSHAQPKNGVLHR